MSHYTCPRCSKRKTYYAECCFDCLNLERSLRKICPYCGGRKQAPSRMCGSCYEASRGDKTSSVCPECGSAMARKSVGGVCLNCYKRNGRLNPVHNEDGTTLLPLPRGEFTLIDTEDFPLVESYSWHLSGNGYVCAVIPGTGRKQLYLHRVILRLDGNEIVDHRDRNKLNNTKANLAVGTQSENMHNIRPRRGRRFRGVTLRKDTGRFSATIKAHGVTYALGCFDSEHEAAAAYNDAALRLFGRRAVLNDLAPTG